MAGWGGGSSAGFRSSTVEAGSRGDSRTRASGADRLPQRSYSGCCRQARPGQSAPPAAESRPFRWARSSRPQGVGWGRGTGAGRGTGLGRLGCAVTTAGVWRAGGDRGPEEASPCPQDRLSEGKGWLEARRELWGGGTGLFPSPKRAVGDPGPRTAAETMAVWAKQLPHPEAITS